MIPKIIHYCWFGPKQIPEDHQQFIRRWKELMPDYEYVCWNENKIDVSSNSFLKQAYDAKMWAFVADYTRIYALIKYGGIYMDTDVEVCERFDPFLNYSFFTSVEYHPNYADAPLLAKMTDSLGKRLPEIPPYKKIPGVGLMSAVFGAEKESEFLKQLLAWYDKMSFEENRRENYTIPTTLAIVAEKYGFRYKNEKQLLAESMAIFPSNVFADFRTSDKNSVAIHHCEGSWSSQGGFIKNLVMELYKHALSRKLYMGLRNCFSKYPVRY